METNQAETSGLTAEKLQEIRERAEATIKGPWRWFGNRSVDDIYLATTHSGRQFLLQPNTRTEQYVYDADESEAYTLEEARERYLHPVEKLPPPRHDYSALDLEGLKKLATARELVVKGDDEDIYVDALVSYDDQHWLQEGNWFATVEGQIALQDFLSGEISEDEGSRWLRNDKNQGKLARGVAVRTDLRFQRDGLMQSYRDIARFEVLNGKTEAEHVESGAPGNLYREDIVGIDNPEAEFIAHSREDVDALLAEVDRLQAELNSRA